MPGALKNPIKRLPLDCPAAADVSIEVKAMTWDHVSVWHSVVQPIINANYQHDAVGVDERNVRADAGWDWTFNYALTLLHNSARILPRNVSGPARALTVTITSAAGVEIPVGLLTVVPSFQCNVGNVAGKRAFAWYLADAPKEFYTRLGISAIKGVARTLVDSAVQSGFDVGGAGNTLLHADPKGGKKLHDFYLIGCGMTQVHVHNGAISVLRRNNPNQYYHMDAPTALKFTSRFDPRR